MKKIYIAFFLSLTYTIAATAQDYNKFKVGFGFGLALSPDQYGSNGAFLITFEPAYRISDNLSIGLRIDNLLQYNASSSSGLNAFQSYTWNGQFYFSAEKFRPFVGAGLGFYEVSSYDSKTIFGFYPRIGFDVGHFSLSLDYNIIPVSKNYTDNFKNHLDMRIGFFIGGGKI